MNHVVESVDFSSKLIDLIVGVLANILISTQIFNDLLLFDELLFPFLDVLEEQVDLSILLIVPLLETTHVVQLNL